MTDVSPKKDTYFEVLARMCIPRSSERCKGKNGVDFYRCKEKEMNECVVDFCNTFVCGD